MNPPSALHSAMNRDRKPFTYTPGGINLSEIKSQRMAQRLMRNAMNPGVPEIPAHPVQPSTTPIIPVALPNYNCMPVQVFPAMPANPKTLLRSRSNPEPRDTTIYRPIPSANVNNVRFEDNDAFYKNRLTYSQPTNNNRLVSINENNNTDKDYNAPSLLAYHNGGITAGATTNLCVHSYKPAFAHTPVAAQVPSPEIAPVPSPVIAPVPSPLPAPVPSPVTVPVSLPVLAPIASPMSTLTFAPVSDATQIIPEISNDNDKFVESKACEEKKTATAHNTKDTSVDQKAVLTEDIEANPFEVINTSPNNETPTSAEVTKFKEENEDIDNEQKEVKVVKKQVTKETKVREQNGNPNGDTNDETEMTVKLPTKKSGAKTETTVEVERKTLPDGTIEEVKTTTTKTTVDGRTEIKTKIETTIIPKDEESEEEIVEEEEEEEADENVDHQNECEETEAIAVTETTATPKENRGLTKTEERSEITITKKIATVQESSKPEQSEVTEQEEEFEDEEVEEGETEPLTIVPKKQATPEPKTESKPDEEELEEELEEEVEEEIEDVEETEAIEQEITEDEIKTEVKEKLQEDEENEKCTKTEAKEEKLPKDEEIEIEVEVRESDVIKDDKEKEVEEECEETIEKNVETNGKIDLKTETEEIKDKKEEEPLEISTKQAQIDNTSEEVTSEPKEAITEKEHIIPVHIQLSEETNLKTKEEKPEDKPTEFTVPIREPSIPLEKVEDIEIKPIGATPIITKTHTENTEIITNTIDPSGGVSKQTEYNKIENIITVNRTTKILDQNYENLTQQGIPTVKTYFPPPTVETFSTTPMPSRPYQPVYCPEPTPERRHSLLLERLSMERQMPSDIYHYSNQTYEQTQYQSEPQSEVLTVSNVKPSTITNQKWYQQTNQTQNVLYNNATSNQPTTNAPWVQPKSPQPQQQFPPQQPPSQSQPQTQFQTQYQPPSQPQFQRGTTPQTQFQRGTIPQSQFQKAATPHTQYQTSYSEPIQERTPVNNYSSYSTKPTWVANTTENTSAPYSYINKDITESYQKSTLNSTTQYSSGYVPPPWEQDSTYTSVNNTSEKYYQEVPRTTPTQTFSPTPSQGWKPAPLPAKCTKTSPIAYVPPAPNQSFVKPVVEAPRHPGRKTYYSEYERRYITVPESTYIPTETKFQPQPDPSPQYYYDNNEPSETVEPQWRKELREFTEKTSQTQTIEQSNIQPPWEVDPKYAKTPSSAYTPTPTWSQTLRPQSNRERNFESDFVSQEWPKTSTMGRRRPLSTMDVSTDGKITERVRGVSVDRYNPNSYQPPAEHPPVPTHTLTTPTPHASYHNPNVPYHARASAEPREQPIPYQQRVYREARASPLQSRSFKYLQWITGTEN